MFHKPVESAYFGDRAALLMTNLNASLLERTLICSHVSTTGANNASESKTSSALSLVRECHGLITLVKRIRHFKQAVQSNKKFHITVGHQTTVAKVTFFGRAQVKEALGSLNMNDIKSENALKDTRGFPNVLFEPQQSYEFDEELLQGGKVLSPYSQMSYSLMMSFCSKLVVLCFSLLC